MDKTRTTAALNRLKPVWFLIFVLLAPNSVAAQTSFDRVVVFGTSLSDAGNAFSFTGETHTAPYDTLDSFLVPFTSYARGGHHFSNGATWVEQFARPRGLAQNVRPAFHDMNPGATNYAIGGTRARITGINLTLADQVGAFLNDFGNQAPSDALYVVEIGSNDVRDALVTFLVIAQMDPPTMDPFDAASAAVQEALAEISDNIDTLYAAGARKFLILNVPDIGVTPSVQNLDQALSQGGAVIFLANLLSEEFNSGLNETLGILGSNPGINFVQLDLYDIANDIIGNPMDFGLSVVDTACLTPLTPPFTCHKPDEYFFWDGIHPTKSVHAIVAEEATILLASQ